MQRSYAVVCVCGGVWGYTDLSQALAHTCLSGEGFTPSFSIELRI